jgi:hypothetical protein
MRMRMRMRVIEGTGSSRIIMRFMRAGGRLRLRLMLDDGWIGRFE